VPPSELPQPTQNDAVRWSRYVAIGDSFTEGLWDGDDSTGVQGWADRLAGALSARRVAQGQEPIEYANLAIRGRLAHGVIREQLAPALKLKPDLVSIVAGGNDALRINGDIDATTALLDRAVGTIRRAGADVLLANSADPVASPLIRMTRGRVARFYASIWSIARRHGAYVADLWGMRSLKDWDMWARDRIHLTPEGHRRVANAALVALGLGPDDPDFDSERPAPPPKTSAEWARWQAEWIRGDLVPWVARHAKGRSSGDGRSPKHPLPTQMPPAPATLDTTPH
jgi:lysophospholipase L1-like esterase